MSGERIVIRPPALSRLWALAFGAFWFGLLGTAFVRSLDGGLSGGLLVVFGMLVCGAFVISVNLRQRVVVEADEVRVRNALVERHYRRTDVREFISHTPGGLPSALGGQVAMLLADSTLIELRATATGPFGRSRRTDHLECLQRWLRTS